MRKLTFLLACLFLVGIGLVNAQSKSISGKVISADDGQPVIGAAVKVKGAATGTITNSEGVFRISVSENAKTLVVSYVGMKSAEVEVKQNLVVSLKSDSKLMDEVLVVAYGTSKKSSFTGSASVVGAAKLADRSFSNATAALEGSTPGVSVSGNDGQPGSALNVRIRGFGSVNASNAPLYVVDGIPFESAISTISPDDIESMTILKDAASTALYGAKAANGIVVITTKKGKGEKTKVQFKATTGVVSRGLAEEKMVGVNDYMKLSWEMLKNQKMNPATGTAMDATTAGQYASDNLISGALYMNPYNVGDKQIFDASGNLNSSASLKYADDLDWFGALERNGLRQDYSMNISGGTDKTHYYFSLGYMNEKGYIINSDFDRYNVRANIDTKVTSYFKTGISINGSRSNSSYARTSSDDASAFVNPFNFVRGMAPIYPIHLHESDGSYSLDEFGKQQYDYTSTRATNSGRHIVAETEWNKNSYVRQVLGVRAFAEISFLHDFKLTLNGAGDFSDYKESVYENTKVGDGAPAGRGQRDFSDSKTWNLNQVLSYEKTFGLHSIAVKAIHESYSYTFQDLYAMRQGLIAEGNYELVNFTTTNDVYSYTSKKSTESYLGNLEYNFNNKYYISANLNYSASSKFEKDHRWGTFWGVGASWRVDQENFMKQFDFVNSLKLRSSYGQNGNEFLLDQVTFTEDYFPYQSLYSIQSNAAEAGFWFSSVENKKLSWEKNAQFDVALEYALFDRFRGSVEYYNRQSSNLLFSEPLAYSTGITSVWRNIGTMFNRGFEVQLAVDPIKTKDFVWTIDVTAATNRNKITKMPKNTDGSPKEIVKGTRKLSEGHSMYDFWLRQYYGVNPKDGSALYYAQDTKTTANQVIINNDTLTTSANNAKYAYSGSSLPDVQGTITNTFKYKNFDVSFLFTYSLGGKIYDTNYQSLMSAATYGAKHTDILKRWQKEGDVTDVPRMDAGRSTDFNANSSRFLISRNYLMFKNFTVGYSFPKAWMHAIEAAEGRIFVSGENLLYVSQRKGMNVSESFAGTTSNVYNPSKIYSIGVNVSF